MIRVCLKLALKYFCISIHKMYGKHFNYKINIILNAVKIKIQSTAFKIRIGPYRCFNYVDYNTEVLRPVHTGDYSHRKQRL